MEKNKIGADNFKRRLEELDITAYKLYKDTGINRSLIYKWLNGERNLEVISLPHAIKLCKALKFDSLDSFIEYMKKEN